MMKPWHVGIFFFLKLILYIYLPIHTQFLNFKLKFSGENYQLFNVHA